MWLRSEFGVDYRVQLGNLNTKKYFEASMVRMFCTRPTCTMLIHSIVLRSYRVIEIEDPTELLSNLNFEVEVGRIFAEVQQLSTSTASTLSNVAPRIVDEHSCRSADPILSSLESHSRLKFLCSFKQKFSTNHASTVRIAMVNNCT